MLNSNIVSTLELRKHFADKEVLALSKTRWKYVPYPNFMPWSFEKKKTTFLGVIGLTQPHEFLDRLWDDSLWDLIANRSATQLSCRARLITLADIRKYFAMILFRGIIGLVSYKDLWASDYFHIETELRQYFLPKNVFDEISMKMEFPALEVHRHLVSQFKNHCVPSYWVTVDELRIPARHFKCEEKQYNNKKPDVWAVESKSLHDESRYLLDFIYPFNDGPTSKPSPRDSLFQFASYLQTTTRHHHITADSNFLSAKDIPKLGKMNFEATCSVKKNRPAWLFAQGLGHALPRSYTRVAKCKNMIAVSTFNNGIINLASNLYRVVNDKACYDSKERRELLKVYDRTKGAADNFGQLFKSYYQAQKFRNYRITVLVGWFYWAITNAYIIYNSKGGPLPHRGFIYEIVKHLLNS